jgi:esterase/lipase superfamily enzyme
VKVFFGTDRKEDASALDLGKRFTAEWDDVLQLGSVKVSLPPNPNRKMGELPRPSWIRLQFKEDPDKHVVLTEVTCLGKKTFFERLNRALNVKSRPTAFVFAHGYNVTFKTAALRTAQIAVDTGLESVPIFYSWPSSGKVKSYVSDEQKADWTRANLLTFLDLLATSTPAEEIVVIAHSMGARPATWALGRLLARRPEFRHRFRELILAAPDIDAAVFKRDILPELAPLSARMTLYASAKDRALAASHAIHGGPRAGDAGGDIVVASGLETVDATAIDTDFLGHSYVATTRPLITDLSCLLGLNARAPDRKWLDAVSQGGNIHWVFRP